ncbi:autoinducer synthase [Leisingera sp. S132]|uniref:acyl-homoserine-lactone synthase n=1 Tax=Leisingera sp. S132 TaxID=2867016 RepID=UPI0021A40D57|nr:acyl-homoserine-lactone synthase [Leisingera sp. S132]UWQ80289.1 autoinducer synthase [Leisingera sp. S132]
MLRYVYGRDLHKYADLAHSMFCDRADQFKIRLGWDVHVNALGEERDQYDELDPLYMIWELPDGSHGGSMRFLPTTGRVMVNEVFLDLCDGVPICSPLIWECTRFCLSRRSQGKVGSALMLGSLEIMRTFGIPHYTAVFYQHTARAFRNLGFGPEIVSTDGQKRNPICMGYWEYTEETYLNVAAKAGIAPELSQLWFDRSFGGAGTAVPLALTA